MPLNPLLASIEVSRKMEKSGRLWLWEATANSSQDQSPMRS